MSRADWVCPSDLFNYIGPTHKNGIKRVNLNCQSACNKRDELDASFGSLSIFMMLSGTWYHQNSAVWQPPNYRCFTQSRTVTRGAGVCILVRNELIVQRIEAFCTVTEDYEVLSVICSNLLVTVWYRPSDGNIERFFLFLENVFTSISNNHYELIWGGDFIIGLLASTP